MNEDPPGLPPGLALAWEPPPRPRRGPQPAHSVAKIVGAAVELADADGLDAVSLHNVAARVGVSTNALYNYVGSKEELLVLLQDAGLADVPKELPTESGWRRLASAWCRALQARFGEHPWLLELPVRGAPLTPGPLRWLEIVLVALDGTGLSDAEQLACAQLLDGHARNTATLARDLAASPHSRLSPQAATFVLDHLRDQGFDRLHALISGGGYSGGPPSDEADFGLDRLLDGIEAIITSRADGA